MWRELGPSVLPVEPGPDKNPGCSWWVFKFILSVSFVMGFWYFGCPIFLFLCSKKVLNGK